MRSYLWDILADPNIEAEHYTARCEACGSIPVPAGGGALLADNFSAIGIVAEMGGG